MSHNFAQSLEVRSSEAHLYLAFLEAEIYPFQKVVFFDDIEIIEAH